MSNIVKAGVFALAALLWFSTMGRLLPLSWGFTAVFILVLPSVAGAVVALGYGVQAAADSLLNARGYSRAARRR
jgi:hypothetical protein